jgi:hypothetical protein
MKCAYQITRKAISSHSWVKEIFFCVGPSHQLIDTIKIKISITNIIASEFHLEILLIKVISTINANIMKIRISVFKKLKYENVIHHFVFP